MYQVSVGKEALVCKEAGATPIPACPLLPRTLLRRINTVELLLMFRNQLPVLAFHIAILAHQLALGQPGYATSDVSWFYVYFSGQVSRWGSASKLIVSHRC